MKAIVQYKYGGVDTLQLEDVEKPVLKKNQVLIKVHSANVASGDWRLNTLNVPFGFKTIIRLLFGWNKPRNKIRGLSGAGEVVEVGEEVTLYEVGDHVNFINSMGASALAEFIALKETSMMAKVNKDIDFTQAAPIAFGAMSAYHFINEHSVRKGDKVLIYGASGSVGSYAIQLAKYFKGRVTAISSQKHHEALKELGVDHVIDYTKTDFRKTSKTYDLIFDAVGKISKSSVKNNLNNNGKFFSIKKATKEDKLRLAFLNDLLQKKEIITLIDQEFPLEKYKQAHDLVYSGHKQGNVVIKITDN